MAKPPARTTGRQAAKAAPKAAPQQDVRMPGGPTPASAAATAPRPQGGFYSPSGDAPAADARAQVNSAIVDQAVPLEGGADSESVTADLAASPFASFLRANDRAPDPAVVTDAIALDGIDLPEGEESLEQAIARIRSVRKPLGTHSAKLAHPEIPGYKLHWFNHDAARLEEATGAGWAFVNDTDGKPKKRAVGKGREGGVMYAYLLKLPLVFWQEDMARKHAAAAERVDQLKARPFQAPPGSAQASDAMKFYSPTEGRDPLSVSKV